MRVCALMFAESTNGVAIFTMLDSKIFFYRMAIFKCCAFFYIYIKLNYDTK